MKSSIRVAVAAVAVAYLAGPASAQSFPDKEVKIIVNYGAGGAVDRTARSMQKYLPQAFGQNVVVENVGGAGGKLGIESFLKAPRDGYTVLTSFAPATTYVATTSPDIFKFDDLAIINVQWVDPAVLISHNKTGWKTADDMISAIKASPKKFTFGSSGTTSVGHVLAVDMFEKLGLEVRIVPYKGGGKTRAAFIAGEVDMTAAGIGGAVRAKDAGIPIVLYADKPAKVWPEAVPLSQSLKDAGVQIGGAYRFHAVHADVKRDYPDRFEAIIAAFKETTVDNAEFVSFADESKVGRDWLGPEASAELLQSVETRFSKMF